jgi:uncharacterized membrane protein YgdD (TMEM256/DUF423 family)
MPSVNSPRRAPSAAARAFTLLGALFGALGVGLGAFGAHGLRAYFAANPARADSYDTAVLYHLVHAAALLATAALTQAYPGRWARAAGWLFAVGIVLFSGSLYLLAVADLRFMGAVAPFGGAAFIAGWLSLGVAAWRSGRTPAA